MFEAGKLEVSRLSLPTLITQCFNTQCMKISFRSPVPSGHLINLQLGRMKRCTGSFQGILCGSCSRTTRLVSNKWYISDHFLQ